MTKILLQNLDGQTEISAELVKLPLIFDQPIDDFLTTGTCHDRNSAFVGVFSQPLMDRHIVDIQFFDDADTVPNTDADRSLTAAAAAGPDGAFGLRGEIERHLGDQGKRFFRVEVNQQYQTRWRELLMLHRAENGDVPALNRLEPLPRLGRLG